MGSAYGINNCLAWYTTQPDFNSGDSTLAKCNAVFSDAGSTQALNGAPVQQWSDSSGNGNHATQSTSANRPLFRQFGGWHPGGNQAAVSFDQLGGAPQYLTLPSGVAIGNGSPASEGTILLALRGTLDGFPLALGNCGLWSNSSNFPSWYNGSENTFPTPNFFPLYHPHIFALRFKSGQSRYYYGSSYVDTIASNLLSGSLSGGFLGSLNGSGFFANAELYEVMVFNQALTDANMTYLLRLLQDRVCPEWSNSANILFFGDSRTKGCNNNIGLNFPWFRAWPYRALRNIGGYAKASTIAVVGNTIAQQKTAFLAAAATLNGSWPTNICMGEVGINDVQANTSAATIYAALVDLWTTMLANGAANVIPLTIAPATSNTTSQETVRQSVNAMILSTNIGGITICDNASDPRLSLTGYPDYDGLHFLDAGYAVYSENAAPILRTVLGISPTPGSDKLSQGAFDTNGGSRSLTYGTFV